MVQRFDRGFRFPLQKYPDEKALYSNFRYLQEYLNYIRKKDKYATTVIVAASDSDEAQRADYHADGENDNVEIQSALDDLSSTGGEIVLLEGTYNFASGGEILAPNAEIRMRGAGATLNLTLGRIKGGGGLLHLDGLGITGSAATPGGNGTTMIGGSGDMIVTNCNFHDISADAVLGAKILGEFSTWIIVGNYFRDIDLNRGGVNINNSALFISDEGGSRQADGLFANNYIDTITITDFTGNTHYIAYSEGDGNDILVIGNSVQNISELTGFVAGEARASHNLIDGVMVAGDHTGIDIDDEQVQDIVGAMVTGNTETLIAVTYDDSDGTLDFVVEDDLSLYDNTTSGFQDATEVSAIIVADVDKAFVDALNVDADTLDSIDSTGFSLAAHVHLLGDLSDVGVGTPSAGNLLEGDGDSWESVAPSTMDAADFGSGTATDGFLLTADGVGGAAWEAAPAGGAFDLDDAGDVVITTPADNELLAFDTVSGDWINQTPTEAGLPLGVLGYAEVATSQTGISTITDLTGLAVTVDVAASRRIQITGQTTVIQRTGGGTAEGIIRESSTGLGTFGRHTLQTNESDLFYGSVVTAPSAGSHTYKLSLQTSANTVDSLPGAGKAAFILVEDIGSA